MGIYAHHLSLNAIWCELGISADVVPLQLGYALIVVSCSSPTGPPRGDAGASCLLGR